MTTKAMIGVMSPKALECTESPETGRFKKQNLPYSLKRKHGPNKIDFSPMMQILNFWSPEL